MKRPSSEHAMRCVVFGSESLLIECAKTWLDAGHEIAAVVTHDAKIRDWARRLELPVLSPGRELVGELSAIDFDYLFSITWLEIISDEILALPKRAAINFHDGPLPKYAGMYAPVWALLEGAEEYGIAFHEISGGVDEGPIFVERRFPLDEDETSLTLNARNYEAAIEAFGELTEGLTSGELRPTPQDLSQRSYFGRHQRPATLGLLLFDAPATEIARQVRALDFGHYENAFGSAMLLHGGQWCAVGTAAVATDSVDGKAPGSLLAIDGDALVIACCDAALRLTGLRCPAGLPLTASEAAKHLGMKVGDTAQDCGDAQWEAFTSLGEQATQKEAMNVRALARFESVALPTIHEAGSTSGNVEVLDFSVPELDADLAGSNGGDAALTLFAALVARLCRREEVGFAYRDDEMTARGDRFGSLFASRVALSLTLDAKQSVRETCRRLTDRLCKTRERSVALGDLLLRYPKLADNADVMASGPKSLGLGLFEDLFDHVRDPELDFEFCVSKDGQRARLAFDPSVVSEEDATWLRDHFVAFVEACAGDPRCEIGSVSLLSEEESDLLLQAWNETDVDHARERCVHELIEAQAAATPDAVALFHREQALRYDELLERSGRLANHLRGLGVGPDDVVAIHLDRSIDLVVAMLGVLRSGAAYLPLDPGYPSERLAFMLGDSNARVLIGKRSSSTLAAKEGVALVSLQADAQAIAEQPCEVEAGSVTPEHLAYVIYTSGSTGTPKGVMIEHGNVVNFFAGMDERVPHEEGGTWLAVTSASFDISVLELLWTLSHGFEVVIQEEGVAAAEGASALERVPWRKMDFGLSMWGSETAPGEGAYDLMLECARFADRSGFDSFHTPERHFADFGGSYPNPSVTSAAVAAVTERIKVRSASCVVPLHHPVRVAEEWAVVDNLSGGRAEIAFASGWQPNDFVIQPQNHARAKQVMFESADMVRQLWRGEAVEFENPLGDMVPTSTQPRPVQKELNAWITTAGNVETFEMAGARGYNVLTHLLGQSLEETAQKIAAYRAAREAAGFDPATGKVTLMLHTCVGEDNDTVRELVRGPMKAYLASAVSLVMGFAWTFPAFARPGGPDSKPEDVDLASLSAEEVDTILEFAFERYYETSGLFGTPDVCAEMVDRCRAADVDEICALVDFGLPKADVLEGLKFLNEVREQASIAPEQMGGEEDRGEGRGDTVAESIARRGVTHLQCTPSMATMLISDAETRRQLSNVHHLMIGGEAFPPRLAGELSARSLTNMYGPTETTIWSSTEAIEGEAGRITVGKPIANTRFYIVDGHGELLPPGVPGELVIGGEGVARGYLGREELTAERFVPDHFGPGRPNARLYRTGDLARWTPDGRVEVLGRMDEQVKIRGHRIELGEIEARLESLADVHEAAVVAKPSEAGFELVAYVVADTAAEDTASYREALRKCLPEFMVPGIYVEMDSFPRTPNGKLDRKALPDPKPTRRESSTPMAKPEGELEVTLAGIWREVLCIEEVGIDDNFFDLGGHSLLVVQVHRKLREAWEKPVSLTDLYRFPTIRKLSEFLEGGGTAAAEAAASKARGEKRRAAAGRRRRQSRGR